MLYVIKLIIMLDKYKINYIIATWNGIRWIKSTNSNKRRKENEQERHKQEDVLKIHLEHLVKLKNDITNITIVKPINEDKNNILIKYYDVIEDESIRKNVPNMTTISCKNYGFSYGQWLLAMKQQVDEYDYHILVEDDTVGGIDNFDSKMIELYKELFKDGIGYLCGFAARKKHMPYHAAISYGIISKESIKKLMKYWENNPYDQLGKIYNKKDKKDENKTPSIEDGGKCQIEFSLILMEAGIPIKDWCEKYVTNFWHKSDKNSDTVITYSKQRNGQQLIIPTQMIDSPKIKYEKNKKQFY